MCSGEAIASRQVDFGPHACRLDLCLVEYLDIGVFGNVNVTPKVTSVMCYNGYC